MAASNKFAEQVNMPKPQGGWRALAMLEESFKAIEGPVARRKVLVRAGLPTGVVYSIKGKLMYLLHTGRRVPTMGRLYVPYLLRVAKG